MSAPGCARWLSSMMEPWPIANPVARFALDHAVLLEGLERGRIEPEQRRVDRAVVLAEERGAGDLGRRVRQTHRIARDRHPPAMRVLDGHDHPAVDQVRV